jgi:transposase-like protein
MNESKKPRRKSGTAKSEVEAAIPEACRTEEAAVAFLEAQRWPTGPTCLGCGSEAVYAMTDKDGGRNKRFLWRCRETECHQQFTVRIGTVMEESRIPLRIWLYAIFRACSSKKGISALQIKRECGLSYKSALFLMHRIRCGMDDTTDKLSGVVEADETFVGGKFRNMHASARREIKSLGGDNKTPVMAIIQRGGEVRAGVLPTVSAGTLRAALMNNVRLDSEIHTDENPGYRTATPPFLGAHFTVNHSRGTYVGMMGETVNTCESYFALLKRRIHGTHHAVSLKHLHRYVAEASFLWNTRDMDDGGRTITAIRATAGKRLRYKEPAGRTC